MKRMIVFVMMLALLLTACGTKQSRIIYQDNAVTISRSGAQTRIADAQTTEAYTFTIRRVKREQSEATACKTTTDTSTLTIMTARDTIIIIEKLSRQYISIRATR